LELYPYMFGAIPLCVWSYTPICYQGVDSQNFVVCFLLGNSPASEFRRRGITQKKAYNIQNTAKV